MLSNICLIGKHMAEIPLIVIAALVFLSGPSEPADTRPSAQQLSTTSTLSEAPSNSDHARSKIKKSRQVSTSVPSVYPHDRQSSDYKAIRSYINTTYPNVTEDDANAIARYLVDYSREHNIDPKLAAALIARESGFDKRAISATGAKGLGQIKGFNFQSLDIKDPYDIRQNVRGTVKYLKNMVTVWKDRSESVALGLASYYKGAGAVKRENARIDGKTKGYVQDILTTYDDLVKIESNHRSESE